MSSWLPIADAPKNGHKRLAGWSANWPSWRQIYRKQSKWWCATENGPALCAPTHFIELPDGPAPKEEAAQTAPAAKAGPASRPTTPRK